jgi:XTP/dITP diphosphohydrolase
MEKNIIMNKMIFASSNPGKIQEIKALLPEWNIVGLSDIKWDTEIEETGKTLAENAEIKASTIYTATGIPVFADDTGLLVDALNGEPGVYSARYAGPECDANANMDKMLLALNGESNRKARFCTSICFMDGKGVHFFEGEVLGNIAAQRLGEKGFGYDPIFVPEGSDLSFAQMTSQKKNEISHRGRALQKLKQFLTKTN